MIIKLNFYELEKIINILFTYFNYYKILLDNMYVRIFRFFYKDKKLYIVYNNIEIKVIFSFSDIKVEGNEVEFDYVFSVTELYNIIKFINIYNEVIFDVDKLNFIFADDMYFGIKNIKLGSEVKEEIYNNRYLGNDEEIKEILIDDNKMAEIKKIRKIFSLKNNKFNNVYFNKEDMTYFNFFNIYVRKYNNTFNFNLDLFNFNILCDIIKNNNIVKLAIKDNNIKLDDDTIIIINSDIKIEEEDKYLVDRIFNDQKKLIENLNLKLEIFNFVSSVISRDSFASLVFDNGMIYVSSGKADFGYVFVNNNFNSYFVLNAVLLYKVLKFILSLCDKKIDYFEFKIIEYEKQNYIYINNKDVEVIFEVLGNLQDDDEYFDEDEMEEEIEDE